MEQLAAATAGSTNLSLLAIVLHMGSFATAAAALG